MEHKGLCSVCGKDYSRNRPLRGKTCGRKCSGELRRSLLEQRHCLACALPFYCKPSSKVRYCSIGCFNRRAKTRKADMIRVCVGCGKDFKRHAGHINQRFCSHACRYEKVEPRPCKGCGIEFSPKKPHSVYCTRRCAVHTAASKRRESGIVPHGDYSMRPSDCTRCGWCIEPNILEKHHIDRDRKNNHQSNLIYLCPTCHTLDHYLARDGQFSNNLGRKKRAD
jgi:hypothetical protein